MWATQITTQMSNVQITKQYENATTDKWNVSLIFRWLKVITPSPGRLQVIWKSGYKEVKGSAHPAPVETQAGEYEVIILASPWHAQAGVEGEGFKWLVHLYLGQQFCSGTN